MTQPAAKICVKCSRDVAHERRVKDPRGRYYCADCYEAARQAAEQPPDMLTGIDDEIAQSMAQNRPEAEATTAPTRQLVREAAVANQAPRSGGGLTCPCCGNELGIGEGICVGCGIRVPSGRPVITALGRDLDALYSKTESIIRWLSWLVWLGLYPIASEAYASKKPIATWIVAILTTITSLGFFIAYQANSDSPGVTQLMLWPKAAPISDEELAAFYEENKDSGIGATLRELANDPEAEWSKLPEKERVIAACRDVGIGEPGGDFRWYQLLTNVFLHDPDSISGFIFHLGGNMLFLLIFGTRVNALIGNFKMAILYPLLGILASAAHLAFSRHDIPMPALGASGAIMGLAGMYIVFFPVQKVHMAFWLKLSWLFPTWIKIWSMRGFWVLGFYIAFDVIATLATSEDGVAHWAHLGGFIAGVTIGAVLLIVRLQDARHADLLSVVLGKAAWPLIGKPDPLVRGVVVG